MVTCQAGREDTNGNHYSERNWHNEEVKLFGTSVHSTLFKICQSNGEKRQNFLDGIVNLRFASVVFKSKSRYSTYIERALTDCLFPDASQKESPSLEAHISYNVVAKCFDANSRPV